jgi:hypothetical protein
MKKNKEIVDCKDYFFRDQYNRKIGIAFWDDADITLCVPKSNANLNIVFKKRTMKQIVLRLIGEYYKFFTDSEKQTLIKKLGEK